MSRPPGRRGSGGRGPTRTGRRGRSRSKTSCLMWWAVPVLMLLSAIALVVTA